MDRWSTWREYSTRFADQTALDLLCWQKYAICTVQINIFRFISSMWAMKCGCTGADPDRVQGFQKPGQISKIYLEIDSLSLDLCSFFLPNDFFVISMVHCQAQTFNWEANICFPTERLTADELLLVPRKQNESDQISSLLKNEKLSICIAQLHLSRKSLKFFFNRAQNRFTSLFSVS